MLQLYFLLFIFCSSLYSWQVVTQHEIDSIATEANAVILNDSNLLLVSENELEYSIKRSILIKNRKTLAFTTVRLRTSDFSEVYDIEAIIKDTLGNVIKELDSDDIEEAEVSPDNTLYDNTKFKWFEFPHTNFPFIIEYSYIIKFYSHFFWPSWFPQSSIPVLSSSYALQFDEKVKYKTHAVGIDLSPIRFVSDGDSLIKWHLTNIPPAKKEDFIPPENNIQIALLFAPLEFTLGEYKGSFQSWDDLAKWYSSMAKQRYELSADNKQEIFEKIKDVKNESEIIQILYQYLQENTRYIAIALGVGGWQPHHANEAYLNRYGDCKDLSTLMISMLDVANIKAYPALALPRNYGVVLKDFPSNQFNHVITYVPFEHDTIWLECTADFRDFEDTPFSIEGVNALVVKEDRGELIQTPIKKAEENKWISNTRGDLIKTGNLIFDTKIKTSGNQKNYFRDQIAYKKSDELKRTLNKLLSNYVEPLKISEYAFLENKSGKPIELNLTGHFRKFARRAGKRLFLNPNVFNRKATNTIPEEDKERQFPVYFNYPYCDIDTIIIDLPNNYILESAPEMQNLNHSFAKYETTYDFQDNAFIYTRHFENKLRTIPVSEYMAYKQFLKKVVDFDESKFIFKEK